MGYKHKYVCHQGEYAKNDDEDGFFEVHVNTMEGFGHNFDRSWLPPDSGISQEELSLYLTLNTVKT